MILLKTKPFNFNVGLSYKKCAPFLPMSSLTCMRVSGMFGLSVKSKMIQILKVNFKKSFKSKVC